jgi:hypothetical protein
MAVSPWSGLERHITVSIGAQPRDSMTVLQKRSRPVTFRVSAEEYEALMKSCVESGARSLADFARLVVLQRAEGTDQRTGTLQGDLNALSKALGELDMALDLARKRIRDLLGPSARESENNGTP